MAQHGIYYARVSPGDAFDICLAAHQPCLINSPQLGRLTLEYHSPILDTTTFVAFKQHVPLDLITRESRRIITASDFHYRYFHVRLDF